MVRLYRFAIENSLYEVPSGGNIEHRSFSGRFLYYVDTDVSPIAGTQSDNAPVAFYLGYMNPEYSGSLWTYEDPSRRGRTLEVMRYERELWQTSTWKQVGSDLGWEIYQKPSRKQWVLMAMPTSRSVRELMVVPVESSIWRWWSRDRVIADERNQTAVEEALIVDDRDLIKVEPVYATIKHRMSSHRVKLGFDYPFNPDFYNPYGSDMGWPLYSVDGRQWKVSYDIGDPEKTAVFTELKKWDEVDDGSIYGGIDIVMPTRFTQVIQGDTIHRILLPEGSPFDPYDYQVYDVDPVSGWPIYLVNGTEWMVSEGHEAGVHNGLPYAVFTVRKVTDQRPDIQYTVIYKNKLPITVELGMGAPFVPSEQTSRGTTHDGWEEYDIGGRLWKVSAVDGVAVFTEMTWPDLVGLDIDPTDTKGEEEAVKPVITEEEEETGSAVAIIDKVGDIVEVELERGYVPFVVALAALGLFSIMAQRHK